VAKTNELNRSPFMGQKKAKNHHVSFGEEPSRASGSSFQRRHGGHEVTFVYVWVGAGEPGVRGW